jgi:hypothetical protein
MPMGQVQQLKNARAMVDIRQLVTSNLGTMTATINVAQGMLVLRDPTPPATGSASSAELHCQEPNLPKRVTDITTVLRNLCPWT